MKLSETTSEKKNHVLGHNWHMSVIEDRASEEYEDVNLFHDELVDILILRYSIRSGFVYEII